MKHASRKKSNKNKLGHHFSKILRESGMIIMTAAALFLFVALLSFHHGDPGWSQTSTSTQIKNAGGKVGAWFADFLLYLFGYLAYLFPIMLTYNATLLLDSKTPNVAPFNSKLFGLRSIGFLGILVAGCSLISLYLPHIHAHLPYTSGGIIGVVIEDCLDKTLNPIGTSIVLFAILCMSWTIFTGISWLIFFDKLGAASLKLFSFTKHILVVIQEIRIKRKNSQLEKVAPVKIIPKSTVSAAPKIEAPALTREEKNIKKTVIPYVPKPTKMLQPKIPIDGDLPSANLLDPPQLSSAQNRISHEKLEHMSREVEARLKDYGINVHVVAVHPGPVITRFEIELAPGIKVSRITSLAKDLARSLSVISVRVVEVIPGKSVVGIELPNEYREVVRLSEIISSLQYEQAKSPVTLALGKDISGHPVVVDLAKMPHLLVAGTTGSGKSVGVNAMLMGLLFKSKPEDLRLILVDPKMLELSIYEGIPHLLTPVVTDMKEAANALRWCVAEMERRYRLMAALGVRNLIGFNKKVIEAQNKKEPIPDPFADPAARLTLGKVPYIVVVIDEYADMMMVVGKKTEQLIARIAQKARAAGIHLILATQRPSVDVITGLIKANIPTRIAYQVSSKIDSRTVLDQGGAEQLLGHGDMLYLPPGTSVPVRVHGAFVADDEVHHVVADWKQRGAPEYIEAITVASGPENDASLAGDFLDTSEKDELYDQAVYIVTSTRRATISSIQRRLKIGYNRAARLIEDMEKAGIVSAMESNGNREVLAAPPPPQEYD